MIMNFNIIKLGEEKKGTHIKSSIYKHIETILTDYTRTEQLIEDIRQSIQYPATERDENVGGGKGNKTSRAVEALAVRLADEPHIRMLQLYQSTIRECLANTDEDTRNIIQLCYFGRLNHTINEIEAQRLLPIEGKTMRRKRREFIENVGKCLGWC